MWRDAHGKILNVTQKLQSGRFFNILEPSPTDFTEDDLALGLSREARWGGQTNGEYPYSVAQHSLLVMEIMRSALRISAPDQLLYGLLHDAEEGLGAKDTITGLKHVIGDTYIEISVGIREVVHLKYDLVWPPPQNITKRVKKADHIAGAMEAVSLMNFKIDEYHARIGKKVEIPSDAYDWSFLLNPWHPQDARKNFVSALKDFHCLVIDAKERKGGCGT